MEFEIYEDAAGGWRWRLRAANGRTVADGSEAYVSEGNVRRAVGMIQTVGMSLSQAGVNLKPHRASKTSKARRGVAESPGGARMMGVALEALGAKHGGE
jgi:uncharacterized protein YegP (UPF0339 family)